ncbi:Inner membrane protein YdjM [Candidatus Hartigia pinicola]|nr:Inner membrane protein YdjM [Candidatus Hartigia pinicola]
MTAQGHLFFSVASLIMAHKLKLTLEFTRGDWLHMIPGILLGALLPDIDHPFSTLGRLLRILSLPISKICGHRGFTHSLVAWLMLLIFCYQWLPNIWLIPNDLTQAFLLGYISHLIADMLTLTGVPLLWPLLFRFRLPLLPKKTNQRTERFIAIIFIVGACLLPSDYNIDLLSQVKNILQYFSF